jgi:hypothetical protein
MFLLYTINKIKLIHAYLKLIIKLKLNNLNSKNKIGDGNRTIHINRDTNKEKGTKYLKLQNQSKLGNTKRKSQEAGDKQHTHDSQIKGHATGTETQPKANT